MIEKFVINLIDILKIHLMFALSRLRKNGSCVKAKPRASARYETLTRHGNSLSLSRHLKKAKIKRKKAFIWHIFRKNLFTLTYIYAQFLACHINSGNSTTR